MKKIVAVIAIIIGVLLVIGGVAPMIIGTVLKMQIPDSVGIIGGADGPTAIMVTGVLSTGHVIGEIVVGILLVAAGVWGYRKWKK